MAYLHPQRKGFNGFEDKAVGDSKGEFPLAAGRIRASEKGRQ